jgi:hypothetical protein
MTTSSADPANQSVFRHTLELPDFGILPPTGKGPLKVQALKQPEHSHDVFHLAFHHCVGVMISMSSINRGSSRVYSSDTKVETWAKYALVFPVLYKLISPEQPSPTDITNVLTLLKRLQEQNFQQLTHSSTYFYQLFSFDDSVSGFYCLR